MSIAFIHDSAYIGDGIVIVLGALSLVAGVVQLALGRLRYPNALGRLRRQLPATSGDVRLEGLVIALRATTIIVLGFGIFMWHLLLGQRPDQTLLVIFWIASVTVAHQWRSVDARRADRRQQAPIHPPAIGGPAPHDVIRALAARPGTLRQSGSGTRSHHG